MRIFQPFYPIHPPVGVGYLLSAAEREGIRAVHIDQQVEDDVLGAVAAYVKDMNKPYVFAFSVLTAAVKNAIGLAGELKKLYPGCFIVFGGVHPTLVPEECLRGAEAIDLISLYESDSSFIKMMDHANGKAPESELEHLAALIEGDYVSIDERSSPDQEAIDPGPDYGALNIGEYSSIGECGSYRFWLPEGTRSATVLSNRGCRELYCRRQLRAWDHRGGLLFSELL